MAASTFTADELELLTPDELDGLKELMADEKADALTVGDDEEDAPDPAQALEQQAADDAAAAAAVEGAKPQPAIAAVVPPVVEPAAVAEPDAPAPRATADALPDWKAPADAKAQIQSLRQAQESLAAKFDDGELTAREFNAQRSQLDDRLADLRELTLKESLGNESRLHNWQANIVPDFFADHPEYAESPAMYSALDAEVRALQTASGNQYDPGQLTNAHNAVQTAIRKALGLPDPAPQPEPKADPKPKVDLGTRVIPPTLASVPAAEGNELGDGGKYAYLDRLADKDPQAFEDAMAKLPEAERDAYLAQ